MFVIKKIVKIGNSYGVILDKKLRRELGLAEVGLVTMKILKRSKGLLLLTLNKKESKSPRTIDSDAYLRAQKQLQRFENLD